jgi:Ca2+-binding RTX toxin-like protein
VAVFNLTGSPVDSLIGLSTEADAFIVAASGRLVGTDTVQGGGGAFVDTLRVTATMTLAAGAFAYVREIERLQIVAAAGAVVTLDDAMVASTNRPVFEVLGGIGADAIHGGLVLATPMLFDLGAGNDLAEGGGGADTLRPGLGADTVLGGGGDDLIEMALADLGADDRLGGGAGNDLLRLSGPGALTAAMLGAIEGIERIELDPANAVAQAVALGPGLTGGVTRLALVAALGNDTLRGSEATVALLLDGGAGNDRLIGGGLADTLIGGAGDDVLLGLAGNDVLEGSEGQDRLVGDAGNDLLIGGAGNDTLLGGAGNDTVAFGIGLDRADGGAGNDLYQALVGELTSSDLIADEAGSADTLEFGDVFDTLAATFLGVSISGSLAGRLLGIERFLLGSGNDTVLAGNAIGDSAGADVVTIAGGLGNDRLDVTQVTRLTTPLAFLLDGGAGADTLLGGRGADTLSPGGGDDRVVGGLGNDLFLVPSAELSSFDSLQGEAGTDTLRLVGNAPLAAPAFANVAGIEVIELGAGGQAVTLPGAFADALGFTMATIRGGDGDDAIDVSAFASVRRVTVELGPGNDTLLGGAGNDSVFAGTGADEIHVGGGINRVTFGVGEFSGLDTITASTSLAFDTLVIGVGAGRTIPQGAFAGVSGFDTFNFDGGTGSAVRLPATLVSQSGQSSGTVNVNGESMAVDGRAIPSAFRLDGGTGDDTLFGGSAADTLVGNGGDDVLVGGPGGDRIFLGTSTTSVEVALLRSASDGTLDINSTVSTAGADSVSGTEFAGNFIVVDRFGFGLPSSTFSDISAGENINLAEPGARLTGVTVAADNFGSLAAVRDAVGARLTNNDPLAVDKLILGIIGASNTRFGLYYFEDRDDNATVDSTDILRLLAIGTWSATADRSASGFRMTDNFELL